MVGRDGGGGKRRRVRPWRGDPPGPEDQGRCGGCFPWQLRPGKPVGLLGWILCPPRPPLGCIVPRGVEGSRGRRGEVDSEGSSGSEDQGRHGGHFAHPRRPQEACWAPGPGPLPSGALSSLVGPRGIGRR